MSGPALPVLNPEAVRAAIGAIRGLDLRGSSIEEISELLTPMFRGYKAIAPKFQPGLRLFRTRICDKPLHISELSYPPAPLTPLGRVNRPGSPILYCCTSRSAPFFESRPEIGQTVAIVWWITTAPLHVNHVGYTASVFQTLGSNREQAGWGPEPARVPGEDINVQVAEFLAETFTRAVPKGSEYLYKLSVAIAEKLFLDDMFDGLLYPTVQMRANADNFALKPRYADSHLQFLKAEFARINGIDAVREFTFGIDVLDTATELTPEGTIVWKGHGDQWTLQSQGEELYLKVEDGGWVARDSTGRLVDPD